MKTAILTAIAALMLAACANSGSGSNEMYGEIKAGVQSSHTR